MYFVQVLNVPRLSALTYWDSHFPKASNVLKPSHNLKEAVLHVKPRTARLAKQFSSLRKLTLSAVTTVFQEKDVLPLSALSSLSSLTIEGYCPMQGSILRAFTDLSRYDSALITYLSTNIHQLALKRPESEAGWTNLHIICHVKIWKIHSWSISDKLHNTFTGLKVMLHITQSYLTMSWIWQHDHLVCPCPALPLS